ncbi:MAG TPA: thermonuclease family protein [Vicinamibacterales bacterium]
MPWQTVERIVTGSLIEVRGYGLVQLAGIEDAGELSRAFLAGILSSQAVRVIPTEHSPDGLTYALVYTPDGRLVNAEMLRLGYARVRASRDFDRLGEFRGLQQDAERLKRGLWAETPASADAQMPMSPARGSAPRRFYLGAGGGATFSAGGRRDWMAGIETGAALSRAFGLYLAAGYLHDFGDARTAGAERAWYGSAGLRVIVPAQTTLRPYLRAGGGYMRIESDGAADARRDRPFWEAGGGLLIAGGPMQLDAGYIFARVDGTDVTRVFGLLGIRF